MPSRHLLPVLLLGALALGACSSAPDGTAPRESSAPVASAPAVGPSPDSAGAIAGPVAAGEQWAHVHNLTVDGDLLLIGTHGGLWSQLAGEPAQQVSEHSFDVMGFAQAGSVMYSSGHPGPGQDAPPDLGLQTSQDAGRTWESTSLRGQVDFHRLRAQDSIVQGLSAHDGKLLRSTDAGATWSDLGSPGLFDFALDPSDPEIVVATQQSGTVRSTDGGSTFGPLPDAPLLAFLSWTGDRLYGVATDNTLQVSTDAGATWKKVGQVQGQPQALGADGDHVVALAGSTVWDSTDGGRTFAPRITGIAAH